MSSPLSGVPSAAAWRSVAIAITATDGLPIPTTSGILAICLTALAVAIILARTYLIPPKYKQYVPNPSAAGLAFVIYQSECKVFGRFSPANMLVQPSTELPWLSVPLVDTGGRGRIRQATRGWRSWCVQYPALVIMVLLTLQSAVRGWYDHRRGSWRRSPSHPHNRRSGTRRRISSRMPRNGMLSNANQCVQCSTRIREQ